MAATAVGGVVKVSKHKRNYIMLLPDDIERLIRSFLPRPPVPYIQIPLYYSYDYMSIDDWNETEDTRSYGDF